MRLGAWQQNRGRDPGAYRGTTRTPIEDGSALGSRGGIASEGATATGGGAAATDGGAGGSGPDIRGASVSPGADAAGAPEPEALAIQPVTICCNRIRTRTSAARNTSRTALRGQPVLRRLDESNGLLSASAFNWAARNDTGPLSHWRRRTNKAPPPAAP